jgi:hypothetical protein
MFNSKNKKFFFTIFELIVAFAVFMILIIIVLRLYSGVYSVTSKASRQGMVFENARIAMDLITRDLQCAYYRNGAAPFWHWKPDNKPAAWGDYRNELLAFVSATSLPPNDVCNSNLCEIKYQLFYSTNKENEYNGWLRRSATGDHTTSASNPKWNFYYNTGVGYETDILLTNSSGFTANSTSSEDYQKVIPHVTELNFTCYDKDGNVIEPDKNITVIENAGTVTDFPYSVEVEMKLMDKDSWAKWLSLFSGTDYPETEPASASSFRQQNERQFKKTVFIGERG